MLLAIVVDAAIVAKGVRRYLTGTLHRIVAVAVSSRQFRRGSEPWLQNTRIHDSAAGRPLETLDVAIAAIAAIVVVDPFHCHLGRKFVITTVGGGGPDVAGVVEEMYYTARERERDKKEWYRY